MNPMAEVVEIAGGPSKLAAQLGVTAQAVIFWRDGKRQVPERLGAPLEAAALRRVRRWHLWPHDWHVIWPELVGSEGAPDVPAAQEVPSAP